MKANVLLPEGGDLPQPMDHLKDPFYSSQLDDFLDQSVSLPHIPNIYQTRKTNFRIP